MTATMQHKCRRSPKRTETGVFAVALLAGLAAGGAGCTPVYENPKPTAKAETFVPSTPVISRADLDTTVAPCHDFHQYAAGGWYRHTPRSTRDTMATGPERARAGIALRQLVARAPALARTTQDPTLQAVGSFYGSCLADTTGEARGRKGDTTRAGYCFGATRKHLDRALFELLMEYVWPPLAREENRQFWGHMKAAAAARFAGSGALPDSVKRQLVALTADIALFASEAWGRDSTIQLWQREVQWPSGVRGPSDAPYASSAVAATWTYRDYAGIGLSPTDFRKNVARLQAAPDSLPLPALFRSMSSSSRELPPLLLDVLLREEPYQAQGEFGRVGLPLGMLIMPVVDGRIDIGAWYGMIGPLAGHEMSHGTWRSPARVTPLTGRSKAVQVAFVVEQLGDQRLRGREELQTEEEYYKDDPNWREHPFDDAIGVLVAYDAFKRATDGRSWPSIDGFTPEQRFFLGVARGWRGGPATMSPVENGQTRWRVLTNGTLSALPAFARAFGCQAGAPMASGRVWNRAPWHGVTLMPEQQTDLYRDYAANVSRALWTWKRESKVAMTVAQRAARLQLMVAQRVPRDALPSQHQGHEGGDSEARAALDALIDSLVESKVESAPAQRQLLRLLGQQVGVWRATLTPEQQAAFDAETSEARRGHQIEISGAQPP